MPHAVFETGSIAATAEMAQRVLIPGVEPGGSRAGDATKPALLIRDAWVEIVDFDTVTDDRSGMHIFLKLSQEIDLTPGLLLPVHECHIAGSAVANQGRMGLAFRDTFHAQGTVWAPRVVGVRVVEAGVVLSFNARLHLDYEVVDIPWMDWFIMWDFLDNVVDNSLEY